MTKICVVGLGRIGLPLSLLLAQAGHRVIGVDASSAVLKEIRNNARAGKNGNTERALLKSFLDKRFFVTTDLHSALSESKVVFIIINTGISPDGRPDLSNLLSLVRKMCDQPEVVKGRLFIFKSTVPVGTTRRISAFIEEKTGLKCGMDFFAAFCPERVLGDKAISEMGCLPKVIGPMDEASSRKSKSIMATLGGKQIVVGCPESAELIKLMDNAYRQTMFAFANDFALVAERFGIDARKLIAAANESYPRNNIAMPSPGVSGYCLYKDPLYLEAAFDEVASKRGFHSVWYWARKTNDYMPAHVVDLLEQKLKNCGKSLHRANVLVCGITYKENVDDFRNSHGLEIATRLREKGAKVFLWDPRVRSADLDFKMVKDPSKIIETLDALVFTVKHEEFIQLNKGNAILRLIRKMRTRIISDGWGIFQGLTKYKDVHYLGVGNTE